MKAVKNAIFVIGATALLLLSGCAVSPEDEARRAAAEADIDEIMSYELDPAEFGEVRRCLSDHEYDDFRPLGDRHILFDGRRDKRWINVLRGRCTDLRHGDMLVVKQRMGSRMCEMDRFSVGDLFDYTYGRRPSDWGSGGPCLLGEFYPVTEAQVEEIEAVLESLKR